MADLRVPYFVELYEPLLGGPFPAHRDSASELVGNTVQNAIEYVLTCTCITYRNTKQSQQVLGFDQAPAFFVPNGYNPSVVIEDKLPQGDSMARDQVARVQHLEDLIRQRQSEGKASCKMVACIVRRGFKEGPRENEEAAFPDSVKVFTLPNMNQLVSNTRLAYFHAP